MAAGKWTIRRRAGIGIVLAGWLIGGGHTARAQGTAEEAMAMVRQAVSHLRDAGAENTYRAITAQEPGFRDRDLYVVVYDREGHCLAHGANPRLVGKALIDIQDVDGKFYIRERTERARTETTFWQDYKFINPVTRKIQAKSTYCDASPGIIVCTGIYHP